MFDPCTDRAVRLILVFVGKSDGESRTLIVFVAQKVGHLRIFDPEGCIIDIDYAQLIKIYGPTADMSGPERKYSPRECRGIREQRFLGKPIKALVSTSYVEKHNQAMGSQMKRFARLANGHSKKIDNHVHMVALYTCWYNFARRNSAVRMSPAMACGLEQRLWDIGDIVKLIEEWEAQYQSAA